MEKYKPRVPKTLEEKEVVRKQLQIFIAAMVVALIYYTLILLMVPKVPNNLFYLNLDIFLDTYLLGHIMPEFSSNFYFSMKVAWCTSFVYEVFAFFILLLTIHIHLKPSGIVVFTYLRKYDKIPAPTMVLANLFMLLAMLYSSFFALAIYAFGFGNTALTLGKGIYDVFYGKFFAASIFFLFINALVVRPVMQAFAEQFYFKLFKFFK